MKNRKKKRPLTLERKRALYGYLFTLPLILGIVTMFLPNIVKTIIFSINKTTVEPGGYTLEFAGMQYYYKVLFEDAKFIQYLTSSLGELLVQVPVILIFSLFMAMVLNQEFKGRTIARAVFFLPVILSTGVIAKVDATSEVAGLMSMKGAMDSGEMEAGLQLTAILMSMNFNETLTEIVVKAANGITEVVNSSGMQIFIFLASFQQIPASVFEAAQVEGCSKWELFWKIIIPMNAKQIIVAGVYTIIDVFTNSESELFNYIHDMAYTNNQYSFAMAMYLVYALGLTVMLGISLITIYQMMGRSERVVKYSEKKR